MLRFRGTVNAFRSCGSQCVALPHTPSVLNPAHREAPRQIQTLPWIVCRSSETGVSTEARTEASSDSADLVSIAVQPAAPSTEGAAGRSADPASHSIPDAPSAAMTDAVQPATSQAEQMVADAMQAMQDNATPSAPAESEAFEVLRAQAIEQYFFDPAVLDGSMDPEAYYNKLEEQRRQEMYRRLAFDLGTSADYVEQQLANVKVLLPDLPGIEELPKDVVVQMLQHVEQLPMRVVGMRDLMPRVNLSSLFVRMPRLLVEPPLPWLSEHLKYLRRSLPNTDVDALVDAEPSLLITDINVVFASIRTMLGNDADCEQVIRDCPTVITMRPMGVNNFW